jgi:hypothetical protein
VTENSGPRVERRVERAECGRGFGHGSDLGSGRDGRSRWCLMIEEEGGGRWRWLGTC